MKTVLTLNRPKGNALVVAQDDGGLYYVSATNPAPVTEAELAQIEAAIGGDERGAALVATFRNRMSA